MGRIFVSVDGLPMDADGALKAALRSVAGADLIYGGTSSADRPFDPAVASLAVSSFSATVASVMLYFRIREVRSKAVETVNPAPALEAALTEVKARTSYVLDSSALRAVEAALANGATRGQVEGPSYVVRFAYDDESNYLVIEAFQTTHDARL